MREPTEAQQQQYTRLTEILDMGKQRYVQATGNHKGYRGGIKGQDYLTDKEREEAKLLLKQLFVTSSEGFVTDSKQQLEKQSSTLSSIEE